MKIVFWTFLTALVMLSGCSSDSDSASTVLSWMHPADITDFISPSGGGAINAHASVGTNGDAVIVWADGPNFFNKLIYKSEYRNGIWTHPADLTDSISPFNSEAANPQVAVGANGETVIVWSESDGLNHYIFMSEYRNGIWTHPTDGSDAISQSSNSPLSPQVAISANGDAVIAWSQRNSSNVEQIYFSEYRGGAWTHPADLDDSISLDVGPASQVHLALGTNGDTIIVWAQEGGGAAILMSEYRNNTWIHPGDITDRISPTGPNPIDPSVSIDSNGDAIIVWKQDGDRVLKSEYRDGVWTHPVDIDDNINISLDVTIPFNVARPKVAMSSNGTAVIAWEQRVESDHIQVFMSEYRNGTWTHPADLEDFISQPAVDALGPQVAMSSNGDAVIVWKQRNAANVNHTFKSELRGGVWTHPSDRNDHISPVGGAVDRPQVAMGINAVSLIVWNQSNGSQDHIYKSEYK